MVDRRVIDRGFTLIEMIVVIVLLGIVMTVIAGVVTVILRTEGPTGSRTDDSRSLRGAVTWLSQDATATPPNGFDFANSANTDCAGTVPTGTRLAKLSWTETVSSTTNYRASYWFMDDGGAKALFRYACSGTGAAPYGSTSVIRLTGPLSATTPTVTPITSGANTIGVTISAFASDGTPIKIESGSRNPSNTLPTTTTTTQPTACGVTSIAATPSATVANNGNGVQRLSVATTITINVTGATCGALELRYDRGDGNGTITEAFTTSGSSRTLVLEIDNNQKWSDGATGSHPLSVYNAGVGPLNSAYSLVVT